MPQLFPFAGALVAAAVAASPAPALANPGVPVGPASAITNPGIAAPVASPLRGSPGAQPARGGDDQFRNLFSSWQALDHGPAAASVGTASIPTLTPVAGYRQSSGYGMRVHPVLGNRRAHKGVDLASPIGTPIYAAADGVVSRADWFGAYGLYVQLDHGGTLDTRYGHMSRLNVAPGQRVRKGEVIGYVGSTGRSTGPHLHYEVRIAGKAVDPVPYMQTIERPAVYAAADATLNGQGGPE